MAHPHHYNLPSRGFVTLEMEFIGHAIPVNSSQTMRWRKEITGSTAPPDRSLFPERTVQLADRDRNHSRKGQLLIKECSRSCPSHHGRLRIPLTASGTQLTQRLPEISETIGFYFSTTLSHYSRVLTSIAPLHRALTGFPPL